MKSVFCLVIHVAVCVLVATPPRARCLAQSLHVLTVMLNDSHRTYQLVPFPETALCLHVNVTHTYPYGCHWTINNTQAVDEQHREFVLYADGYSLVLQPFGQHFHYTVCACRLIESGDKYTVMMGGPASSVIGPSITRSELTTSSPVSDPTSDPTYGPTDNTTSDSTSDSANKSLKDLSPGVLASLFLIPVVALTLLSIGIVVSMMIISARRRHHNSSQETIKTTHNVLYEHRKPVSCQHNISYERHTLNV